MVHWFKKFRHLDSAEKGLFFRALATVLIVRIGLRVFPYRLMLRWVEYFRDSTGRRCDLERRQIRQVAWAVEAASRRVPGTMCLPQGMATHLLLGRLGQPSQLRLGVALKAGGELEAHAWVEVNGRVVSGGAIAGFERFVALQQHPS